MAPNVTASEIINSHIVSLREGIDYGDSSIRAPPCPCMAISDSLTVPPISKRLQFRAQNKQQIEPQNSHEMPIRRGRFERTLSKRAAARDNSSHHQRKRDDSRKHMQSVHRRQDVVERTIGIRREVKPLRRELPPGFELPGNENESQREGGHEPTQTDSNGTGFNGRNVGDRARGELERGAAQEKRQRICIKYRWQGDVRPIRPRSLAHKERACESRKRHGDRKNAHPDAALRSPFCSGEYFGNSGCRSRRASQGGGRRSNVPVNCG